MEQQTQRWCVGVAGELLCPLFPRQGGGGCEGIRGRGRGGHTHGCLAPAGWAEFQRSQLVLVPGRRLGKRENVCARAPPGSQARWRGGGAAAATRVEVGVESDPSGWG